MLTAVVASVVGALQSERPCPAPAAAEVPHACGSSSVSMTLGRMGTNGLALDTAVPSLKIGGSSGGVPE